MANNEGIRKCLFMVSYCEDRYEESPIYPHIFYFETLLPRYLTSYPARYLSRQQACDIRIDNDPPLQQGIASILSVGESVNEHMSTSVRAACLYKERVDSIV